MKQLGSGEQDTRDIIIYITQDTKQQKKESKKKLRWWLCLCCCKMSKVYDIIEEYSNC